MSRQTDDFPAIPGFAPVHNGDALETADSPSVGTAATVPDDVLESLDMDDMLRSMILGEIESQNVLPLVYADLRGRLYGVSDANIELREVRSRLGIVALESTELRQHIRSVQSDLEALRRENEVLRQRLCNTENTVATVGSHFSSAFVAASLNVTQRNDAPVPTAIAPPEQQRAVPPSHTAPLPVPTYPPTFTEFMATVPHASAHPLSAAAPQATRSLQTACDLQMPVPPMTQAGTRFDVSDTPGPYCPGLLPLTTLLAPFAEVISYRSYRLRNTWGDVTLAENGNITRIKRRFDDLYPGFAPFDGSTPIRLLEFLTTLRDGFNSLEASEEVAALLLTYYLEGSAKTLYASQHSSGVRSEAGAPAGTWSYLIHEFIKRYLTDDVLQTAYEQVTDARQKANEDENAFADRVAKAARDCCNVFRDRELVNYFIRGLLPATRDAVTERVRNLTPNEQGVNLFVSKVTDITVARRIATAEGNKFRARVKVTTTPAPKKAMSRSSTLFMGEPEVSPNPSPFRRDPDLPQLFAGPDQYWTDLRARDPEHAHTIACQLESLLFADVGDGKTKVPMSPTNTEESFADPVLQRPYSPPPELTKEQIEKARLVIPTDYWGLSCWTCRDNGHTTFTCGHLTPSQRLYFAYCYYVYQCKTNPHMAEWYKQRRAARDKGDYSNVPQPPRSPGRPGRGRGQGTLPF